MKVLLSLLLSLNCLLSFSQNNAAHKALPLESPDMDSHIQKRIPPTVTIKVINYRGNGNDSKIEYTLVTLGSESQVKKFAQLDKQGEARLVLDKHIPFQQVWLTVGNFLYTGIYVNSHLHITIDPVKTKNKKIYFTGDGISYTGTDGELNTIMNKKVVFKKEETEKLGSRLVDQGLQAANNKISITDFQSTADSVYEKIKALNALFITQHPGYAWAVHNEAASDYYSWLLVAYSNRTLPDSLLEKINRHQPFFTSNDGVAFYRQLKNYAAFSKNYPRPDLQAQLEAGYENYTPEQKAILDSIKRYNSSNAHKNIPDALTKKRNTLFFKELALLNLRHWIKNIYRQYPPHRADIVSLILLNHGKDDFATAYPEIRSNITTKWCRQIVQEEFAASLAREKEMTALFAKATSVTADNFYIGKPLSRLLFEADLYRLDSLGSVDDFIVNLRSKFQGKALIIDFWATWCTPCIGDMPYSKKLHEENKDLPVEFIYLCTSSSSNEDTWRKRLAKLATPGTHIFVDDSIVTALKRKLNAGSGFPAYVVIDRDGKVKSTAISFMQPLDRNGLMQVTGLQ